MSFFFVRQKGEGFTSQVRAAAAAAVELSIKVRQTSFLCVLHLIRLTTDIKFENAWSGIKMIFKKLFMLFIGGNMVDGRVTLQSLLHIMS